jgi:hypothetical protein
MQTHGGMNAIKLVIASNNQTVELKPRVKFAASPMTPITANMMPREKLIGVAILKRANDFIISSGLSKYFSDSFSMISPPFKLKRF